MLVEDTKGKRKLNSENVFIKAHHVTALAGSHFITKQDESNFFPPKSDPDHTHMWSKIGSDIFLDVSLGLKFVGNNNNLKSDTHTPRCLMLHA